MHKSNIAHLDIKPDNIVVGKNYEVKLIDFGHCKTMGSKHEYVLDDHNIGTPNYIPPEIANKIPYNPFEVDIFNLGVFLFCLLSA